MNRVYSDDLHLGRIPAELVTPPHTALSLKRCLSGLENVQDVPAAKLFLSASSKAPLEDASRVAIHASAGHGCTPNEPIVLVIKASNSTRSKQQAMESSAGRLPHHSYPTPFEPRYRKYYNGLLQI